MHWCLRAITSASWRTLQVFKFLVVGHVSFFRMFCFTVLKALVRNYLHKIKALGPASRAGAITTGQLLLFAHNFSRLLELDSPNIIFLSTSGTRVAYESTKIQ